MESYMEFLHIHPQHRNPNNQSGTLSERSASDRTSDWKTESENEINNVRGNLKLKDVAKETNQPSVIQFFCDVKQ